MRTEITVSIFDCKDIKLEINHEKKEKEREKEARRPPFHGDRTPTAGRQYD